ncbi:MAG: HEAT repeat domain-containing protein [Planctomycetota bacterium]
MDAEGVRDVDELLTALEHEDPVVRARAAKLFGHMIDPPAHVLAALARGTDDPDPMVRSMSLDALGRHGAHAHEHLDALAAALDDRVVPVRFWAATAVERVVEATGSASTVVLQALLRLANDDDPRGRAARAAARRALARARPYGGAGG